MENQYLNTSYVKVKLLFFHLLMSFELNLNTSYVKVKQWKDKLLVQQKSHLNTSYVKVKPFAVVTTISVAIPFKYILC